jgi:hypothetical protein
LASPEVTDNAEVSKARPQKKVGKLDAVKLFEDKESEEVKKKEYIPGVNVIKQILFVTDTAST